MHWIAECTKCTHNIGEVRRGQFNAGGLSGFYLQHIKLSTVEIMITSIIIMMRYITFSPRINDNGDSIRTMSKVNS